MRILSRRHYKVKMPRKKALAQPSQSGGVNIDAKQVNVGQDLVGRDKYATTNIIVAYDAASLLKQLDLQAAVKRPQPLRILAVIAAPVAGLSDAAPAPISLSGRAEWAALRSAQAFAPIVLARLRPPTENYLRAICSPNNHGKFNIVHFICHGLPGELALEDERGLTTLVDAQRIAAALKDGGVQLAVINACYSAAGATRSLTQALVDAGVRSVIAHQWPLIDPAAVLFTNALYRELAAGRTLQVAFDQAVYETTAKFPAEKGNAIIAGDATLAFPRGNGNMLASQVYEGPSLPDESARFFGRGYELLKLADILSDAHSRGAALTGIGGIGKSALAFEAADRNAWRFAGGVAYVRSPETGISATDALTECARMLGLEPRGNMVGELRDFLNVAPCLLVFDNMERSQRELPALADFASSLNLDAGSKVIVTLRPPLSDRFKNVREINLHEGLDEAAALEYVRFIARSEGSAVEWQQPKIALKLARRVSGHPEFMRLAVFRSKKVPFDQVLKELADLSGKELAEGLQDFIGKQAALAGDDGRQALARLAIFPEPWIVASAATAACSDVVEGLEQLVEQGIVALEKGRVQFYALHPTAIDWVTRNVNLPEGDDISAAKRRAAEAISAFVQRNWLDHDLLSFQHRNTLAALDWAWDDEAWQVVSDLTWHIEDYWRMRGHWRTAAEWMTRGTEATRKLPVSDEQRKRLSRLLHTQAQFQSNLGDLNGAMALYQQSLDIFEGLGDLQGKSATLSQLANITMGQGLWEEAKDLVIKAFQISRRLGDTEGTAFKVAKLGQIAEHEGNLAEAAKLYRESIGHFESLGSPVADQVREMLAQVEKGAKGVNE